MQVSFDNKQIIMLDEVESTNSFASSLPTELPEGSVIVSQFQTNGRGQGSNFWESEKNKNLTFSVLLQPAFVKAVDQFYLSKVISLSLSDLISLYVENVQIKWPNDIYVGDKKIGGILIENSIEKDYISHCTVGIGLNINQEQFTSDAPNPVSLIQLTGETYDKDELLEIYLSVLEYRYNMLLNKEYTTIDQNYLDLLFQYNTLAKYQFEGEIFTGTIIGVENTGELIILDQDGQKRNFWYKEVTFLK